MEEAPYPTRSIELPFGSAGERLPDRQYSLGIPQLLFEGLSERWFLKECGDIHWQMLCRNLGVSSGEILGEDGERLYASFTRVRVETADSFRRFRENEHLRVRSGLSRFGDKRYFSSLVWSSPESEIRCSMGSVFVSRLTDNTSLTRSRPRGRCASSCESHDCAPAFAQDYQLLKASVLSGGSLPLETPVTLAGHTFHLTNAQPKFGFRYAINPYHDLNGVSLLYFASYSRIHDVCEREYVREHGPGGPVPDWALVSSPVARDIYYYGNADATDCLDFQILSTAVTGDCNVAIHSALFRQKDGARIADLFTVKKMHSHVDGFAPLFA